MATLTIDLEAAGLTHARGRSDKCNGAHDIDMLSVTGIDDPDLIRADDLGPVLQSLHEQAHPRGTARREYCRERGCAGMAELEA